MSASPPRMRSGVVWTAGSLAAAGAGGILANALVVRLAGESALGVFNQVFAAYIVLSQFAAAGVHYSVLSHLSRRDEDDAEAATILVSALWPVLGIASFVAILCAGLAPLAAAWLESPSVREGLWWAAPGLVLFALDKALLMALNARRHMRAMALFQAGRAGLLIVLIVGLALWSCPPGRLPAALTGAELLLFLPLATYVHLRVSPLRLAARRASWSGEHLRFGIKGMFSGVLNELNTRVDILILGRFASDSIVGAYSFAALLAEGLGQLTYAVRQNVDPLLGRAFAEHRVQAFGADVRRIRTFVVPGMLLAAVLLAAAFPWLAALSHLVDGRTEAWQALGILLAGVVAASAYRPFAGHLLQGGRPGWNSGLTACVVAVNIALCFALVPSLGALGAALATMGAALVESMLIRATARSFWGLPL